MPDLRKMQTIASITVAVILAGYVSVASFASQQKLAATETPLGIPSADAAGVDYFLKIDGIDGESRNADHKGEIDIGSFSWGASSDAGAAKGAGAGKVSFTDIHFTKNVDKSSPMLMLAAAKGQHIKEAVLTVERSGEKSEQFLQVKLTNVVVSSYQQDGRSGEAPTDGFSLSFAKIEFTYKPLNSDGSPGAAVTGSWDIKENKKI